MAAGAEAYDDEFVEDGAAELEEAAPPRTMLVTATGEEADAHADDVTGDAAEAAEAAEAV